MKRILVSAGDPSGDRYLALLVRELSKTHPGQFEFVGLAGSESRAAGVKCLVDSQTVAVMGITEVIKHLPEIFKALDVLKQELPRCDQVLLIDFPDFNFKIGAEAKRLGVPVHYWMVPQLWAWRSERIYEMAKFVSSVVVGFPFELEMFRQVGIRSSFFGHPLRDLLPPQRRRELREQFAVSDKFVMGILPGSRRGEWTRHLPILIRGWERLQSHSYCPKSLVGFWPLPPGVSVEGPMSCLSRSDQKRLKYLLDSGQWRCDADSYQVFAMSNFAWIASGTAHLEASVYQLPHILFYRLSWLSARVIQTLTNYFQRRNRFAGLANILLEKEVIPEVLQEQLNPNRLVDETIAILQDRPRLWWIEKHLRWVPKKLGQPGNVGRVAVHFAKEWMDGPQGFDQTPGTCEHIDQELNRKGDALA